ncbi:MAG: YdcF family protein [Pedobacter sp.]|uniref:YdcF family protein n=1 Tax=Pedobacter sp. TaxID=1411316 RepID=UPI00339A894E
MKYSTLTLIFIFSAISCFAQKSFPDPAYKLISGTNYVASKNYYLLTLFGQIPELKKMLAADPVLSEIGRMKDERIAEAIRSCGKDVACYIQAVKFSAAEIMQVSSRLGELYKPENELGRLVNKHLLPSGCYILYAGLTGRDMLMKTWEQDAAAINHTIGVYGGGQKPNYPLIDSISFNIRDRGYPELLALNTTLSVSESKKEGLFFTPTMLFAIHSLEMNGRNQVADEEPMAETVNKAALDYAKKIKWSQYKYTLILVPGEGPEDKDTELSAGGMLRCRLAALQYQNGLAPFIMVSGGCVHPYKTKYNEALEMKKFLISTLHIPEYAILAEPHARHTTTNMRNCARLIFRYGFPMDKPFITSTAKSQSYNITDLLPARTQKELGYVPYKVGKRFSATEAEIYPLAVSLQIDFDEPMDP